MERITAPFEAAAPPARVNRPASNGSVPRSMSHRARRVVSPIPRPARFIHFTQRSATSFASKSPFSASDSARSRVIAASSSNGDPLGGGARSRTPWGNASRIAAAVPSPSVGTPSWFPTTSPSRAPRARVSSRGSRASFETRAVKRAAPPPRATAAPAALPAPQAEPLGGFRPHGVDRDAVAQDLDRLDEGVVKRRDSRSEVTGTTRQASGHERRTEPAGHPPAEPPRATADLP